jgi:hypothetical protein
MAESVNMKAAATTSTQPAESMIFLGMPDQTSKKRISPNKDRGCYAAVCRINFWKEGCQQIKGTKQDTLVEHLKFVGRAISVAYVIAPFIHARWDVGGADH